MSEMDDETFNKYIDTDAGDESDDEKENEPKNSGRQPKTTTNQFDMIVAFMKCNNEELMDKETFGQLWDNLAAKLNDVGPPEHTVVEWKKIWSAHKYYENRKRSSTSTLRNQRPRKEPRQDESLQETVFVGDEDFGSANESVPDQSDFSKKLDVIIENQNKIIANLEVIVEVLKAALQSFANQA